MLAEDKINKILENNFGHEVDNLAPIGNGAWSHAYGFSCDNKNYVIRISKLDDNFNQDKWAARFSGEDLPIPQVLTIDKYEDHYYAISERIAGEHIDAVDREHMQRLLPSLLRLFSALKNADLSPTTGFGHWDKYGNGKHSSWQEFLLSVAEDSPGTILHGWKKNLENSDYGSGDFNKIYASFQDVVRHCPNERQLIHSDLLNFNLLIDGDSISGVVDWGSAKYGDFLYDTAWFVFYTPWYESMMGIDFTKEVQDYFTAKGENIPQFSERLLACQLHIGLESIAYNSYKKDWQNAVDAAKRAMSFLG